MYTLSLWELVRVLDRLNIKFEIVSFSKEVAILNFEAPLSPSLHLQVILGGTIKIVKILDVVKKKPKDFADFSLREYFSSSKAEQILGPKTESRLDIGFSAYPAELSQDKLQGQASRIAMQAKSNLTKLGYRIRVVVPKSPTASLSSVTVKHNQLTSKGMELCVFVAKQEIFLGKTMSIQDFEEYGRRDFTRPFRDDKRGMLPPKVAQIMVNLAVLNKDGTVIDPFCGLGTVAQEAALLGYKTFSSDLDKQAVDSASKNLDWFRNRYKLSKNQFSLGVFPAEQLSSHIPKELIEHSAQNNLAIVTEGTLGPIYSSLPSPTARSKNFQNLAELYTKAFADWKKLLPKGSLIVITFPAYKLGVKSYQLFPHLDLVTSLGYNLVSINLPEKSLSKVNLQLTPRGTTVYDRKDQIVAREIAVLRLN